MVTNNKKTLSEAHIKAIGALVVVTSELDSLLTDLIAIFTKTNLINAIITVHHQQFASKVDSLLALCDLHLGEDEFEPIFALIKHVKEVGEFRNTVVHAHWSIDDEGKAYAVRFSARGKLSRSRRPYTSGEIQVRADEGAVLVRKLLSLRDKLTEE